LRAACRWCSGCWASLECCGGHSLGGKVAGLGGFNKLLVIPLVLAQFRRSGRGRLVLYGFLASCAALLIASFVTWFPAFQVTGKAPGIPVRDYIAQSTEFLICAFALLGLAFEACRARSWRLAGGAALLAALFVANILMIATGRTGLVVIVLLLVIFGFRLLGWKGIIAGCVAASCWARSAGYRRPSCARA